MSFLQSLRERALRALGLPSRDDVRALQRALDARAQEDAERIAKRLDRVEHKTDALGHKTDRLEERVWDLAKGLHRGQIKKIDQNVDALVRRAFLPIGSLPKAQQLISGRFHGLSQNEEDGITLGLLTAVGAETSRFVEIGAGNNGGNSGYLARECAWTGLMIDVDAGNARLLHDRFAPAVVVVEARVTRENVNALVEQHRFAGDIDLLSIDIDGNDYWVWEALTCCRPRIVIVEFNAWFGPVKAVTVPYDPSFTYDGAGSRYHGASLQAFVRLSRRKGYRLVVTEPRGVNAFFVREDLAGDLPPLEPTRIPMAIDGKSFVDPDTVFTQLAEAKLPLVEVL